LLQVIILLAIAATAHQTGVPFGGNQNGSENQRTTKNTRHTGLRQATTLTIFIEQPTIICKVSNINVTISNPQR